MLARERARAEFQDWEKKEEEVCFWTVICILFPCPFLNVLNLQFLLLFSCFRDQDIISLPLIICWLTFFHLQFHFDQSKVRSEIRLREGRIKPIDILSKNLNGSDDFDIEINEPYLVFKVIITPHFEILISDQSWSFVFFTVHFPFICLATS